MTKDDKPTVKEIVDTLRADKLVVMRSDTIYGIFASATSVVAVEKLHSIRGRGDKQGFIILVDSVETVAKMVNLSDKVKARLRAIWSAPYATSVILAVDDKLKETWLADTRENSPRICFRVANDPELRKLLKQTGPLCAPSANLPDELPARNIAEARGYFGDKIDLYVDGGLVENVLASRIISFASDGSVKTVRSNGRSHPEDFVITRRRKLYKFAQFDCLESCFHFDEWLAVRDEKLANVGELVVEIGAGSALFSVELARRSPETMFVAVDIKGDRLYQGAREAEHLNLDNIYFVRSDIARINEVIPDDLVDTIWLTFPDPWSAKSDARHRLTASRYLNYYHQMLKTDGVLNFKTDDPSLFEWSLNQFTKDGWSQKFSTQDLHNSDGSDEAKIMTSYEKRFVDGGLMINYAQMTKGASNSR